MEEKLVLSDRKMGDLLIRNWTGDPLHGKIGLILKLNSTPQTYTIFCDYEIVFWSPAYVKNFKTRNNC